MLFYDLDAMRRASEVARELVGGYEAWRSVLVPRYDSTCDGEWDCVPTGPPPTTSTSTFSTGRSEVVMLPGEWRYSA